MAGLAGSALAVVVSFIGPTDYGLLWSFTVIVAAVIGGGGLISGSLIGAAFVTFIPVIFSQLSGLSDGLFGITLVVFIVIAPGGLPAVWARLRAWRPRRPVQVPASASIPLESGAGDPRA
jgi:branched-chain amino acid transport system permease protein